MNRKEADILERAGVAFVEAQVEALDPITSGRPYRKGCFFDQARDEIAVLSRKQFDLQAVEAFLAGEITLHRMVEEKCMKSRDPSIQPDMRSIP